MGGNFGFGVAGQAKVGKTDPSGFRAMGEGLGKKMSKEKFDDEAYLKYMKDIDIQGVDRLDLEASKIRTAKAVAAIEQEMKLHPHSHGIKSSQILRDEKQAHLEDLDRAKKYSAQRETYKKIKDNGGITTRAQDDMYNAMNTGTHDDVIQVHDPREDDESVFVDPYTRDYRMNPIPKIDTEEIKDSFAKDPNHYNKEINTIRNKIQGNGGMISLPNGKQILATDYMLEELAATSGGMAAMNDPQIYRAEKEKQNNSGRLDNFQFRDINGVLSAPKNYADMTQQELHQAVVQNWGDDVMHKAGIKKTRQILTPPKPAAKKEDKSAMGLDEMISSGRLNQNELMTISRNENASQRDYEAFKDELKKTSSYSKLGNQEERDKAINRIVENQKKSDDLVAKNPRMATARYSLPIKSTTSTIVPASTEMINLSNNNALSSRKQFNFLPGGIKVVKVKGKWISMVYGQATDKAVDENSKEYNVTADIAVPLANVEDFLNSKPYETPTKWSHEAVERLNAKKAFPSPTSSQPIKVTSDADYKKVPSGSEYVGPDGKKYRKK